MASSHPGIREHLESVLVDVYSWSRSQGYRGYNKHDALNSPLLRGLLGRGKWPRIIAIQGVMRSPINLRPLLGIPKTYNPKGLALFIQGLLDRYRVSGHEDQLAQAERLLKLLTEIRSPGTWSPPRSRAARPASAGSRARRRLPR